MLLVFLAGRNSYAQEVEDSETEYVELDEGEAAPYHGYLFNSDSLSSVIAKQDKEKNELKLQLETENKKIKLELETELKKKEAELVINTTKYEDLLKLNKEELEKLSREAKYNSWITSASFIGGIIVGSVIVASTIKVTVDLTK